METKAERQECYPKDPVIPSRIARDPKTGYYTDCPARIREVYAHNCFMNRCFPVYLEEIHCGHCVVSMKTDPERHSSDGVHVGTDFLSALADTVLGVTGASMGERVVTVMSSMNFVHGGGHADLCAEQGGPPRADDHGYRKPYHGRGRDVVGDHAVRHDEHREI